MKNEIYCSNNVFAKENFKKCALTNGRRIAVIFDYDTSDENNNYYSGEFLIYNSKYIIKAGGIESICVDDTAGLYPIALIPALGLIYDIYKEETKKHMPRHFNEYDINKAIELISRNRINRKSDIKIFFQAAAFLMGLSENQMKQYASQNLKNIKNEYEFNISYTNKIFLFGTKDIILGLLLDIKKGEKKEIMASKFYKSIIDISVFICKDLREMHGIGKVFLAGKMFEEDETLGLIASELKRNGFDVVNNFR